MNAQCVILQGICLWVCAGMHACVFVRMWRVVFVYLCVCVCVCVCVLPVCVCENVK